MVSLVDTNILLRLRQPADLDYHTIRTALRLLRARRHDLVTTAQNIAEFWNVSTRPVTARGGYALSVAVTDRRLRALERIFRILADTPAAYRLRTLSGDHPSGAGGCGRITSIALGVGLSGWWRG